MFGLVVEPEEKKLLPYRGMPVCLIMKDGSRRIGLLTSCKTGRLILNGEAGDDDEATIARKSAARRTHRKRARKPPDPADAYELHPEAEWDDLSLGPLPEETYASLPRENVPLKSVESVVIL